MRVMSQQYSIAGVKLQINSKEIYLQDELQAFLMSGKNDFGGADVEIAIHDEDLPSFLLLKEGKQLLANEQLRISEYEDFFFIEYLIECSVSCYTVSKVKREAAIYVAKEYRESELIYRIGDEEILMTELMYAIRDSFFFYLQGLGRVVVHSASFLYKEKAWLFAAPSGTGKSTHVELWKRAGYPIQDLNGDLAACYLEESGRVMAAGLPWCGTSGIYSDQIAPLGGIFFLKRSESNKVVSMNHIEGILQLIARLTTPNWTKELADKNAEIAQKVASKVHMAKFCCTMDNEAAEVMKKFIDELF